MLVAGTQMHAITFLFVCIEIVILFYLSIRRLARPDDKKANLNITLISLLILYNVTGGLLPDAKLPGSYVVQTALAYATGFITPSYFPYYVFKAFELERMRFHAFKGVFLCLILPLVAFTSVFASTGNLQLAQNLLFLPMAYAAWVIFSLRKAVGLKYNNDFSTSRARQERAVLLLSLTPWVGLPLIDILHLGQAIEASITNVGFLSLFALQVKEQVIEARQEHEQLLLSEQKLKWWNTTLQAEVEKRTRELARINEEQMNTFINLAHETKTPLTMVNSYMMDYMEKHGNDEELAIVKNNLDKLSDDIVNLFDVEKFKKGFAVYEHDQVAPISKLLDEVIPLFRVYASKKGMRLSARISPELYVKADPHAITRIVNNLIENAIKYTPAGGFVHVSVKLQQDWVLLTVKDSGPGVDKPLQAKIFQPYVQIASKKRNVQGMGLGLPIVKMVVGSIGGTISIESNPSLRPGTEVAVRLPHYILLDADSVATGGTSSHSYLPEEEIEDIVKEAHRKSILLVEDNRPMLAYLAKKLGEQYNVYTATDGSAALQKLNELKIFPELIICDIMMDRLDGYGFASALAANAAYDHIPIIFITAKSSPADRLQGLKLGAIDIIQKPFLYKELLHKVQAVLAITERQRKALLNGLYSIGHNNGIETKDGFKENCNAFHLTARERDIAELVCKGYRYKAIGETLFISEKTVAKHIENIFAKVGASNKIELINKLDCHHQEHSEG